MPKLDKGQAIYYGIQCLAAYHKDKIWAERLYIVRSACVPVDDWTGHMWLEAARIVAKYRRELLHDLSVDVLSFPLIAEAETREPDMGAWHDVKALSPRPSEDQLEEVRVLAEQLRVERRTAPRRHYDVELTPDLGFAVFYGDRYRALKHIRHLPGYCEVEGHAECWLSTKLRDFIVSNGLHAHPNVMPAIAEEIDRMEQQVPWGEALEMASSCADPDLYPDKLIPVLRSMNPIGITWDQGRHSATREA